MSMSNDIALTDSRGSHGMTVFPAEAKEHIFSLANVCPPTHSKREEEREP